MSRHVANILISLLAVVGVFAAAAAWPVVWSAYSAFALTGHSGLVDLVAFAGPPLAALLLVAVWAHRRRVRSSRLVRRVMHREVSR